MKQIEVIVIGYNSNGPITLKKNVQVVSKPIAEPKPFIISPRHQFDDKIFINKGSKYHK